MAKNNPLVHAASFVGKTIKKIDASAVNVLVFYFTDDTSTRLEVEALGLGLYGIVEER